MHGEMEQKERDAIMKDFRSGSRFFLIDFFCFLKVLLCFIAIDLIMNNIFADSSRLLISTDVFARGLDIPQVSLVVNYDLPNNRELYIHR